MLPNWGEGGMLCYWEVSVKIQAPQVASKDAAVDGDGFITAECG